MLDLVPFEKQELKEDKEHNEKVKSEGEITVLKRIIKNLKTYDINIAVMDCMFANVPCINEIKKNKMEVIVKLTDERRCIYKDAKGLFKKQKPIKEYEIVKRIEEKKIKYSKESKKKNEIKTETYEYTREKTKTELKNKITKKDKIVKHPKKEIHEIVKEEVIKKVKINSDIFELEGYEYGLVRVLKVEETFKEKGKEITKEMYIITTMLEEDLEFITDLMHRRWNIELKGFRKLKTRYNMNHLYIGTNNAIRLIHYLMLIIFNLIELYFNIRTRKYKKINYDNLLEDYKFEMATKKIYKYLNTNTS